jgi:hypothetical protein
LWILLERSLGVESWQRKREIAAGERLIARFNASVVK